MWIIVPLEQHFSTKIITHSRVFVSLKFTCPFSDGYNKWRDAKKPTTILNDLCKSKGIPAPEYRITEVKVLNRIFKIPPDAVPEGKDREVDQYQLYQSWHN